MKNKPKLEECGTGLDDKSEQLTNLNDLLVRAFLDQFQ